MSGQPGTSNGSSGSTPSGAAEKNPFPRLSSFKLPRDLSLGAGIPPPKINKKYPVPNLNVVRNKNKTLTPNLIPNNKKDDKSKRDKHNNRNNKFKNGPAVVKSSGVFSEGLGASERHVSRASYSRDSDAAPQQLQRPVLRHKNFAKIDKASEEQKIKKVLGESSVLNESDEENDDSALDGARDAPVRLPVSSGGTLYSAKKLPRVSKLEELVVKKEPVDEDLMVTETASGRKFTPDCAVSAFQFTDIVKLLTSEQPNMMLLQLPDNLPGRGAEEDTPHKNKSTASGEETKVIDNKCRLSDLEEGKIGKIQIYKSGKVKLCLGETSFDLSLGTQPCFRQDVVSVAVNPESRTGTMINLGGIERKLNVIPDWEALFKDVII